MSARRLVPLIYERLLAAAGPRGWWPGEGRDEIIAGAVLTQNTAWSNVVLALKGLKARGLCDLERLAVTPPEEVAPVIRPAGYFNVKARRLRAAAEFFAPGGRARFAELELQPLDRLREALLGVNGVGRETADSILLYALDRPSFVIDAYTLRVLRRHGLAGERTDYEAARSLMTANTPAELQIYNEYHALLVWVGHHFCKPKPRCAACPLFRRECFAGAESWRAAKAAAEAKRAP